jgi:hypothetical protein
MILPSSVVLTLHLSERRRTASVAFLPQRAILFGTINWHASDRTSSEILRNQRMIVGE